MKEVYRIAGASAIGVTGFLYGNTLHLPSEAEQFERIATCADTLAPVAQTGPASEECLPYVTVVSLGDVKLFTLQQEPNGNFSTKDGRPVFEQPSTQKFTEVANKEIKSNSDQKKKERVNKALTGLLFGGLTYLATDAEWYKEYKIKHPAK